jgi:alpha-tubulin suppressor-like RCC1 family protein
MKLLLFLNIAFLTAVHADIAQLAYLKASNPDANDDFGRAVAIDGDTLVIGAPNEDSTATGGPSNNGALEAGAVYVFVRNGSGWTQQALLKPDVVGAGDEFGGTVAIHGNTIVVGATNEASNSITINTGATNNSAAAAGAAYVFVRNGTTWTQQAYLKASNTGAGDEFGYSVAVSGDTAIIGARYEDGGGTDSGAAYVFIRSGTSWTQQRLLRASNDGAGDAFGVSVDIEGDSAIVGAHQEDQLGTDAGAAYVFTRSGTTWTEQQILRATGGGAGDAFGAEVGISGNSVVIRAALEDGSATTVNGTVNNSATSAGAAYVFVRSGSTWSQQAYLKPTNTTAGDQFGRSVDIEGDVVAVGSPFEDSPATGINGNASDNSATDSGAGYILTRSGTTWTQTAYLKASNTSAGDNFGITNTVRIAGSRVIIGSPLEDSSAVGVDGNEALENLSNSGAAYLYDIAAPSLAPVFNSATDIGWRGYDPTLTTRTFAGATLNFAPSPGTTLTLVEKRGLGFLNGTFANLTQGQKVTLNYNGQDYNFIANYYGGNGNDLVLQWAGAVPRSWGAQDFDVTDFDVPFGSIAAGSNHTVALRWDGSVVAWGSYSSGRTTVPSAAQSGVIGIAAGVNHSVAHKQDGSVLVWGDNSEGQTTVPMAARSEVIGIAAGGLHTAVVKQGGSVVAWGSNAYGQTTVPTVAQSGIKAIAAGENHTVALKQDGSVVAWGDNRSGQTTVPTAAQGGVISIAAGGRHSVALKQDGSVLTWGNNSYGQTTVPTSAQSGVVGIAAGLYHTVALKQDGSVVAWGRNDNGQTTVPTSAQSGVVGIAAGGEHTLALKQDGSIAAWGSDTHGQSTVPTSAVNRVLGIDAGLNTVVLTREGTVLAWGENYYGQSSVPMAAQSGIAAISTKRIHTLALKDSGEVIAWGNDSFGESTVPPAAQSGVVAISAGGYHSVALKKDGSLLAWGYNGAEGVITIPAAAQSGVAAISAGLAHTVALKQDGGVVAWGDNVSGQTTVPSAAQSGVTAISAGWFHTVALKQDGSVVAWGNNGSGQATVPLSAQSDVVAISAGQAHTVALKDDGSLVIWGNNSYGQSAIAPWVQSWVSAIAAGSQHNVVLVPQKPRLGLASTSAPSPTGITLHGRINPSGQPATLTVEYGPDTNYGQTAAIPLPEDDGTDFVDANVALTGLTPGTTYHYRLVATSVVGTTTSVDGTFTTLSPPMLNPSWTSAADIPVTAAGYTASGKNFGTPVLSFAPVPGMSLSVINNTAIGFIEGYLSDLVQGQTVQLTYNGLVYNFTASYFGGDGNDLVLQWAGGGLRVWGSSRLDPKDFQLPFVKMSVGHMHSVALRADGTTISWGYNDSNQATVPSGLTGVESVAAGGAHTVALKSDGTVVAWGSNSYGQTNVPAGLSSVAVIAAGYSHTVALKSDGTVIAWGGNFDGQTNVPAGLAGVIAISAGNQHSVALKQDGTVVAWGKIWTGMGFTTATVPAELDHVIAIEAGGNHTVALKEDGTVVAWGASSAGQISPPLGLTAVAAIAAGGQHTIALKNDGTVVAWGYDNVGQATVPAELDGVTAIAAGSFGSLALRSDGTLISWGEWETPGEFHGLIGIESGSNHTLVIRRDGTVAGWGSNFSGQLGVPSGVSSAKAISAGSNHSLALTGNGTVTGWGNNDYGQAVIPQGLANVVSVSAGNHHSLALRSDGTVAAWGANYSSQTTVPAGLSDVCSIATGTSHSIALRMDGSVVGWGTSGGVIDLSVPVGLNGIVAVAAGTYHSLALKSDGTVVAWGFNGSRQTSVPAGLSDVIKLAAGSAHSVALKNDGTIMSWGNGQTSLPVPGDLGFVSNIAAEGSLTSAIVALKPHLPAFTSASATDTAATLGGLVMPNGQITTVHFEYGLTAAFGNTAGAALADPSALTPQAVSTLITGLTPGTTYHYRLVATSVVGTTTSVDGAFTTTAPAISVFDLSTPEAVAVTHNQTTPIDFGSHPVPTMIGVTRLFRVQNTGTDPLLISSITASPLGPFEVLPPLPGILSPGATSEFAVRFSSNTPGTFTGTVSILSNSPTQPTFTFPVTATGLDVAPPTLDVYIGGGNPAPLIPGQPSNPYQSYAKAGVTVSLLISANEPISAPTVTIAGRPVTATENGSSSNWIASIIVDETFPQGPASFSVTATDLSGNVTGPVTSPTTPGNFVIVDTVAPTISSASISSSNPTTGWAKVGDTVSISIIMSDEWSGPQGPLGGFTQPNGLTWNGGNLGNGVFSLTSDPITTEPEGLITVSFQCKDTAGNVALFEPLPFDLPVVVDRTPPVITQGDIKVEATAPGGTNAIFTPTVTDALGAVTSIPCNPPSGSFFPLGSTPVSVSARDSAGNMAAGIFNVTVLESSDFWRDLYFDQTANAGDAADDADPDKDGLVNLIERAFNLHPLQAGTGVLTAGTGTSGLPLVTVQGEGENRRLRMEYLRRKATSMPGITYEAQFSTTLDPEWTPATSESASSIDSQWERVIVEGSPGAIRNFGRVQVSAP